MQAEKVHYANQRGRFLLKIIYSRIDLDTLKPWGAMHPQSGPIHPAKLQRDIPSLGTDGFIKKKTHS